MFVFNQVSQVVCVFFLEYIFWHQLKFTNASPILSKNKVEKVPPERHGYVVAILLNSPDIPVEESLLCGGSLITSNFVLTAAHCFYDFQPYHLTVVAGSLDFTSGNKYDVDSWITYDDWDLKKKHKRRYEINDIAILKLKRDVDSWIRPGILGKAVPDRYRDKQALAVGWGSMNNDKYPTILRQAWLNVLTTEDAEQFVHTDDNFLWSKGDPPAVMQHGDSGSPLLMRIGTSASYLIIGVAKGSGPKHYATVNLKRINSHTSIYPYVQFINDVTSRVLIENKKN